VVDQPHSERHRLAAALERDRAAVFEGRGG
jgi:hypothetical protein